MLGDVLEDAITAEGHSATVCRTLLEAEMTIARGEASLFVVGIWVGAQSRLGEEEQAHLRRLARHLPTVLVAERWWPQPGATALADVANLWLAEELSWLPALVEQALGARPGLGSVPPAAHPGQTVSTSSVGSGGHQSHAPFPP